MRFGQLRLVYGYHYRKVPRMTEYWTKARETGDGDVRPLSFDNEWTRLRA